MGDKVRVGYELYPEGKFTARLDKIYRNPQFDSFVWQWTIGTPPFRGSKITDFTSLSAGPKSKFWQWAGAHLGRGLENGEEVDTDNFVKKIVVLDIGIKDKKDGTKRNYVKSAVSYTKGEGIGPRPVISTEKTIGLFAGNAAPIIPSKSVAASVKEEIPFDDIFEDESQGDEEVPWE